MREYIIKSIMQICCKNSLNYISHETGKHIFTSLDDVVVVLDLNKKIFLSSNTLLLRSTSFERIYSTLHSTLFLRSSTLINSTFYTVN